MTIRRLLAFASIAILFAGPLPAHAASWMYAADVLSPLFPIAAYGNLKLHAAYRGSAIRAHRSGASRDIGFAGNNLLDAAALDSFSGSPNNISKVTTWYDQIGSFNATCDPAAGVAPFCPAIWWQPTANTRGIVFYGEASAPQKYAFYGLSTTPSSFFNPTARDYAVVAVLQPSTSFYTNQANAPAASHGAVFQFYDRTGAQGVAQLVADSGAGGLSNSRLLQLPAWQASDDGNSFVYRPNDGNFVQSNPVVITVVSRSSCGCVEIFQNERVWRVGSQSALVRAANQLLLGHLASTIGGLGGTKNAWGGSMAAFMVYTRTIPTDQQLVRVRAALYQDLGIDQSTSQPDARMFMGLGDSIAMGYLPAIGAYGYQSFLQRQVKSARFLNFGDPGSTITVNPREPDDYVANTQLIKLICPLLSARFAETSRVVLIHGGGNDFLIGPAPLTGTLTRGSATIAMTSTSGLSVGDYVSASVLASPSTITAINPNVSITISGSGAQVIGNSTEAMIFTAPSASPANVYAGIRKIADDANHCGATKVIVSTVLKRNVAYQPLVAALNAIIVGSGIGGATVVDCASYGNLAVNPGPDFSDSGHLSAFAPGTPSGAADMAACLQSAVDAAL